VPTGVTKITVTANGARGNEGVGDGASGAEYDLPGGLGGRVTATITVRPGENLTIFVGGSGRHRGFNGGGTGQLRFGHGGGASDVWQGGDTLGHRVIVAGGGGGGGAVGYCESTSCGYGMGGDGGMGGGREGEEALKDAVTYTAPAAAEEEAARAAPAAAATIVRAAGAAAVLRLRKKARRTCKCSRACVRMMD
jgi:hypothetical protein